MDRYLIGLLQQRLIKKECVTGLFFDFLKDFFQRGFVKREADLLAITAGGGQQAGSNQKSSDWFYTQHLGYYGSFAENQNCEPRANITHGRSSSQRRRMLLSNIGSVCELV